LPTEIQASADMICLLGDAYGIKAYITRDDSSRLKAIQLWQTTIKYRPIHFTSLRHYSNYERFSSFSSVEIVKYAKNYLSNPSYLDHAELKQKYGTINNNNEICKSWLVALDSPDSGFYTHQVIANCCIYDEAVAYYLNIIENNHEKQWYFYDVAEIRLLQHNYQEAIRYYEICIDLGNKGVPAFYTSGANFSISIAKCYESLGNFPKAEDHFKKAIEYGSKCYDRVEKYQENGKQYTRKITCNNREHVFQQWTELGEFYHRRQNFSQAVFCLKKAVDLDSSHGFALGKLRSLFIEAKLVNEGIDFFQNAIKEWTGDLWISNVCATLSELYRELKDFVNEGYWFYWASDYSDNLKSSYIYLLTKFDDITKRRINEKISVDNFRNSLHNIRKVHEDKIVVQQDDQALLLDIVESIPKQTIKTDKKQEEQSDADSIDNKGFNDNDDQTSTTAIDKQSNQYDIKQLLQKLDTNSNDVSVLVSLGKAYAKIQDFAKAEEFYSRASQMIDSNIISHRDTDGEKIKDSTTSQNDNPELNKTIVKAADPIEKDSIICTEDFNTHDNDTELGDVIRHAHGYISPHFITNSEKMLVEMEHPFILLYTDKISLIDDLFDILPEIAQFGRPLLIISEDIEGEVLNTLIDKNMQGIPNVCAVKALGFGDIRKAVMEDIAILINATLFSEDIGRKLNTCVMQDLGRAKKVIADNEKTIIYRGVGDYKSVENRIMQINLKLEEAESENERLFLQRRLAILTNGLKDMQTIKF